jgi:nucleotide-binding universal stress UspA family protein
MKRFKNILFFADREEGLGAALDRAVALSKDNGARLTVMDVTADAGRLSDYVERTYALDLNAQLREQRQQALEELVAAHTLAGSPIYTKVLTGIPFIEIIRAVQRNGYDLLMKVAQSDTGLAPALFGSTDLHLLRKCPCPVWIDRLHKDNDYHRILAAVNPLENESDEVPRLIMDLATSLAQHEHAVLKVVHAWDLPGESILANGRGRIPRKELDLMLENRKSRHRKALDTLLSRYDLDSEADNVHLIKGRSTQIISTCISEWDIDLIVMGTLGRFGVPGLFIGNTAEDVLRKTQAAALAVKPPGFVTPVK